MQYDFDTIIDRNHSWSIKHDFKAQNGKSDEILPLWVADMDFQSPESVITALHHAADHKIFGYSKADERYFDAIQTWYTRRFHWTPERNWMISTPGIVFSISVAVKALTKEGDAILIQPPVYHPFRRAILRNHRTLVENPLLLQNGRYTMDLEDLEEKIVKHNVKMMILCNPHNPIGRVWTKEELLAVSELCLKHHVLVISDEIHGDFVWSGFVQTPYASLSTEAANSCIVCTAPSKTFNLAGLITSNLFIPNPELRHTVSSYLLDLGQENINRMGLISCEAAYRDGEDWLEQLLAYLHENLCLVRTFTSERIPEIKLIEPEGTYLAWLDCRDMCLTDEALERFFSEDAKVWLDPGVHSGEQGSGFMRFNLGSPRSIILEALERIECAWNQRKETLMKQ